MSVMDNLGVLGVRAVRKMKDLASVFRRNRVARDDSSSTTSSAAEPNDGVRELLDVQGFRKAVTLDLPVLIVDIPTRKAVLHPHPRDCTGVEERWFLQKVVDNEGTTGGYFAVTDEKAARDRWPQMTPCKRCS